MFTSKRLRLHAVAVSGLLAAFCSPTWAGWTEFPIGGGWSDYMASAKACQVLTRNPGGGSKYRVVFQVVRNSSPATSIRLSADYRSGKADFSPAGSVSTNRWAQNSRVATLSLDVAPRGGTQLYVFFSVQIAAVPRKHRAFDAAVGGGPINTIATCGGTPGGRYY